MERRAHRELLRDLRAARFRVGNRAIDGRGVAADHDLTPAVEIRRLDGLTWLARALAHCARRREIEAHQCRHRALPDRHRLLHVRAAQVR
jgi:hypothetical protein